MDHKDIEKLYTDYARDVYRYSVFKLRNTENAEDVTSETFLRLMKKESMKDISNQKVWIISTARNVIYEQYRKLKKEEPLNDTEGFEPVDHLEQVENKAIDSETIEMIKEKLDLLGEETREIIILKVWEDMQFDEIAKIVDEKESTVKLRYYRGLEKLKVLVGEKQQGKKMYALSLPLLVLGIAEIAKQNILTTAAFGSIAKGLGLIINTTNMGVTSTLTTGGLKSFLATTTGKLVAGGITAAIVVTCVVGVVIINNNSSTNPEVPNNSDDQPTVTCAKQNYTNSDYAGISFEYDDCEWAFKETKTTSDGAGTIPPVNSYRIEMISKVDNASKLELFIQPNLVTGFGGFCISKPNVKLTDDILRIEDSIGTYIYDGTTNQHPTLKCLASYLGMLTNTLNTNIDSAPYRIVLNTFTNPTLYGLVEVKLYTTNQEVIAKADAFVQAIKLDEGPAPIVLTQSCKNQVVGLEVSFPADWKCTQYTGSPSQQYITISKGEVSISFGQIARGTGCGPQTEALGCTNESLFKNENTSVTIIRQPGVGIVDIVGSSKLGDSINGQISIRMGNARITELPYKEEVLKILAGLKKYQ